MNPMDRAIAAGGWQSLMPAKFPMILGADLAGTVEGVAEGSSRFAAVDPVMGQLLPVRANCVRIARETLEEMPATPRAQSPFCRGTAPGRLRCAARMPGFARSE